MSGYFFENTKMTGKGMNNCTPDFIIFSHIHVPFSMKLEHREIINTGSISNATVMESQFVKGKDLASERANVIVLEGNYGSENLDIFSYSRVVIPYNLKKAIVDAKESDMPHKKAYIKELKTATYQKMYQ